MNQTDTAAEQWLHHEDEVCLADRAERLRWLLSATPPQNLWMFHGGLLATQQFEESRYCFVYGQFVASVLLGLAFVERTLAAKFYAMGRNDLQRATIQELLDEAHKVDWLTASDLIAFNAARDLRNPLTHFRKPTHKNLPDMRAFREDRELDELLEQDAKSVLESVFRLIAKSVIA